jgi:hypothetical protein
MSNTEPTKNYNGWATRTQPKTTIAEQHESNQKLQKMSNMDPNKRLQKMSNTISTKNYNRWATRTQPKTTIDEQHWPQQKTTIDELHEPNQKLQ